MSTLKLIHINIRSLLSKLTAFKDFISASAYDVVAVSETWLSGSILSDAVSIDGFELLRADRGGRGGGVCFYIKSTLQFRVLPTSLASSFEQLWLCLTHGRSRTSIGLIYRPPNASTELFFDEFEEVLSSSILEFDGMVCVGDFNINMLNINDPITTRFNDILDSFEVSQIIDQPTRNTALVSNLLDLVLCSSDGDILDSGVIPTHGLSDHDAVFCVISMSYIVEERPVRTYRDFSKFDRDQMQQAMAMLPLGLIYQFDDIDDKVGFLNLYLLDIFNFFAPYKTRSFDRRPAPWLTDNLRLLMALRDSAHKKYLQTRSPEHFTYYKDLRNFTTTICRNEKKAYLNSKFASANSRVLWNTVKQLNVTNRGSNVLPPQFSNADEINNYFIDSIPHVSGMNRFPHCIYEVGSRLHADEHFFFSEISENQVFDIIHKMKSNSTGCDDITANMLKLSCPTILPYVAHVVNFCISNSVFPSQWKISRILPLPKKKQPSGFKDLRPISILSAMSKILERAMNDQIRAYLEKFGLLPITQSGFRPGHSCASALLHVVDDICSGVDRDMASVLVLLDFSRAFDTIDHDFLYYILLHIGFSFPAAQLIKNYLSNRYQYVQLPKSRSDMRRVECGVPQGSILGPLLFSIYIYKLASSLQYAKIHNYADDTQIYFSFKESDVEGALRTLNRDLQSLAEFAGQHSLKINPAKSAVVVFGSVRTRQRLAGNIRVAIGNGIIPVVDVCDNLGVKLDCGLRFREHVGSCIRKAFGALKLLYGCRSVLNRRARLLLSEALILSHFNFADIVYHSCIDSVAARRIQRMQNCCIRLVCGLRRWQHVSCKLKEINWLNMANRRALHCMRFYHKLIVTGIPQYLYDKITFRTDVHNLNVRSKGLLTPPIHKTAFFERGFSYNIAKRYNELDSNFKRLSVNRFNVAYREQLRRRQDGLG